MSGEDKNKLDEMFKNELDNSVNRFDFLEQDWDAMEQILDADKKPRGLVYWLPVLSGVAALLVIALGWWYFKPAPLKPTQKIAVHQPKSIQAPAQTQAATNNNAVDKSNQLNNGRVVNIPALAANIAKKYHDTDVSHHTPDATQSNNVTDNNISASTNNNNVIAATGNANNNVPKQGTDSAMVTTNTMAAVGSKNAAADDNASNAGVNGSNAKIKRSMLAASNHKGPQFGLTIMVSPDINGVKSFRNARVGTNIGMLFTVKFGKLSVSTGAAYSKKPYLTDFNNYHTNYTFKTNPESVYADCRVLDIPLNIDYQVYHKSKNSFSVGSGLSSYLMLKERYTYDYEQPYTTGPTSYTVINRNRHILGVLNLNATYAHQLNSKFSIAAQPYLKIPLTNIGYSQVRLRSAGVALGLRWNINQSKTP